MISGRCGKWVDLPRHVKLSREEVVGAGWRIIEVMKSEDVRARDQIADVRSEIEGDELKSKRIGVRSG